MSAVASTSLPLVTAAGASRRGCTRPQARRVPSSGLAAPGGRLVVCRIAQRDPEVEGLDVDYCDDFVCTSSPAVAETVKALSRDLCRVNTWTLRLFQPTVEFQDGLRSFTGRDKYENNTFIGDSIEDASVTILKVTMVDKATSQITWRLTGKIAGLDMAAENKSTFEHNQLTGRVESHTDEWSLKCSPPAAAAVTAARTAWALKWASSDAARAGGEVLDSLSSFDDGDQDGYNLKDAGDPTKFFQNQNNNDNNNDIISFTLFCAVLYLVYTAYGSVLSL